MLNLSTLFASFQKGFLKNVLAGAGISAVTTGSTLFVINQMIDHFRSNLGQLSSTALGLFGLSGFDVFFSVVFGAIVTKHYLNSSNISFTRKK